MMVFWSAVIVCSAQAKGMRLEPGLCAGKGVSEEPRRLGKGPG